MPVQMTLEAPSRGVPVKLWTDTARLPCAHAEPPGGRHAEQAQDDTAGALRSIFRRTAAYRNELPEKYGPAECMREFPYIPVRSEID